MAANNVDWANIMSIVFANTNVNFTLNDLQEPTKESSLRFFATIASIVHAMAKKFEPNLHDLDFKRPAVMVNVLNPFLEADDVKLHVIEIVAPTKNTCLAMQILLTTVYNMTVKMCWREKAKEKREKLMADANESKERLFQARINYENLCDQRKKSAQRLSEARHKAEQSEANVKRLRDINRPKQQQLDNINADIERLDGQIKTLRMRVEERQQLDTRATHLKSQLDAAKTCHAELQRKLAEQDKRKLDPGMLNAKRADQRRLIDVREHLDALITDCQTMLYNDGELEKAREACKSVKEACNADKQLLEDAEKKLYEMRRSVEIANAESDAAEEKKRAMVDGLRALEVPLKKWSQYYKKLNDYVDNLDQFNEKLLELQKESESKSESESESDKGGV